QERPTDFDLALSLVVAVEPRRSDYLPSLRIRREQCTARLQRLLKEHPEHWLLIAVVAGVLLPDERVCSYSVQGMKIVHSKRPQLDKLAFQGRLQFKRHCNSDPNVGPNLRRQREF